MPAADKTPRRRLVKRIKQLSLDERQDRSKSELSRQRVARMDRQRGIVRHKPGTWRRSRGGKHLPEDEWRWVHSGGFQDTKEA